jgi:hypothetical protein
LAPGITSLVFDPQDDEEIAVAKKRKLPAAVPPTSNAAVSSHSDKKAKETVDDKRRHIKSLIDKIPTQKQALFEYKVEWDLVRAFSKNACHNLFNVQYSEHPKTDRSVFKWSFSGHFLCLVSNDSKTGLEIKFSTSLYRFIHKKYISFV